MYSRAALHTPLAADGNPVEPAAAAAAAMCWSAQFVHSVVVPVRYDCQCVLHTIVRVLE